MLLNRALNWIVIAIVAIAVIVLFDFILDLVVGLAPIAIPVLIILFLVGIFLRFIGGRRV